MKTIKVAQKSAVLLAASLMAGAVLAAPPSKDEALKLATDAGCMTCHSVERGAKGPNGMAPIGPAWQDVGKQYKGQADAQKKLTQIVLAGSSPYESHWKGKVSGLSMPPNKVAITEADANKLVSWILTLE